MWKHVTHTSIIPLQTKGRLFGIYEKPNIYKHKNKAVS